MPGFHTRQHLEPEPRNNEQPGKFHRGVSLHFERKNGNRHSFRIMKPTFIAIIVLVFASFRPVLSNDAQRSAAEIITYLSWIKIPQIDMHPPYTLKDALKFIHIKTEEACIPEHLNKKHILQLNLPERECEIFRVNGSFVYFDKSILVYSLIWLTDKYFSLEKYETSPRSGRRPGACCFHLFCPHPVVAPVVEPRGA